MRLINADEIIKWADDSVEQYGRTYTTDMLNMFGLFKHVIDNAPTVNIQQFGKNDEYYIVNKAGIKELVNRERPQGRWVSDANKTFITCNQCNYTKGCESPWVRTHFEKLPPFCENCGASMIDDI